MKAAIGVLALVLIMYVISAHAAPMLQAKVGDVTITVYSEKCDLDAVKTLPVKATWEEKGKTFHGCAGAAPHVNAVMFYFLEDRSVAVVPVDVFQRLQGA